jgi:Protein of unknown function (DUF3102)
MRRDPVLAKHAEVIRTLGQRVVKDIVEIGRRLTESKKRVGHGKWAEWLETEFDWSEGTALNFMRVYELAENYKSKNFTDLSFADLIIAPSALYVLARPSTPNGVRDEMLERAAAGEKISHSAVQEALAKHVATAVQEALAAPAAADEALGATPIEVELPPAADEAISTPPAADEQQAAAEPEAGNGQFVEDDPEDAWFRGLFSRAHRGIGDAQRHGDWSKYPIDPGLIEKVRQAAEAWQELHDYLKQRDGQSEGGSLVG